MQFAFTFGRAYNLRDNYVLVDADTEGEAREIFVAAREVAGRLPDSDRRWAFCYPPHAWPDIVARHGMTEVPIDAPIDWHDPANPIE